MSCQIATAIEPPRSQPTSDTGHRVVIDHWLTTPATAELAIRIANTLSAIAATREIRLGVAVPAADRAIRLPSSIQPQPTAATSAEKMMACGQSVANAEWGKITKAKIKAFGLRSVVRNRRSVEAGTGTLISSAPPSRQSRTAVHAMYAAANSGRDRHQRMRRDKRLQDCQQIPDRN